MDIFRSLQTMAGSARSALMSALRPGPTQTIAHQPPQHVRPQMIQPRPGQQITVTPVRSPDLQRAQEQARAQAQTTAHQPQRQQPPPAPAPRAEPATSFYGKGYGRSSPQPRPGGASPAPRSPAPAVQQGQALRDALAGRPPGAETSRTPAYQRLQQHQAALSSKGVSPPAPQPRGSPATTKRTGLLPPRPSADRRVADAVASGEEVARSPASAKRAVSDIVFGVPLVMASTERYKRARDTYQKTYQKQSPLYEQYLKDVEAYESSPLHDQYKTKQA